MSFICALQMNILAQSADDAIGKPIVDIRMNGLMNYQPAQFKKIFAPFLGEPFNFDILAKLETELLATGYFSSIEAMADQNSVPGSLILIFNVIEIPLIQEIRFQGGNRFKGKLLEHVDVKVKEPYSPARVASSVRRLQKAFIDAGFVDARVSWAPKQLDNGNFLVTFIIEEGAALVVESIEFVGLESFFAEDKGREKRLRSVLSQKPKKFLQKGIYQADLIENDRIVIVRFLQQYGHLDAVLEGNTIVEHRLDPDTNTDYLTIRYIVNPGRVWRFGGVTISGNTLYSTEEILKLFANIPVGEVLDYTAFMNAFYSGLVEMYSRDGYIFNIYSDPVETRDEATGEVSFHIDIVEKDRAHVESITISGPTKTRENVIKREIDFDVGDVFSSQKIQRAYMNLMQTGYFEAVVPMVNQGSDIGLVHVGFDVEEGRTTELMFGLSIGGNAGEFPISGMISYGDKNLFGRGYSGKLDFSANIEQISASMSFFNPRVMDSRWGLGGSFGYTRSVQTTRQGWDNIPHNQSGAYVFRGKTVYNNVEYGAGSYFPESRVPTSEEISLYGLIPDYYYFASNIAPMKFVQHDITLGLSTGYIQPLVIGFLRFTAGFDLGWTYTTYDKNLHPALNEISDGYRRWVFNNGLWTRIAWENRNNPSLPTEGFILSQMFYVAGGALGGHRTYIKSQTRFDYYIPLPEVKFSKKENAWSMRWNIKLRSAFSWLGAQGGFGLVGATKEWFTLDGMFLGRGWGDLSPSGRIMWDNSIEFRLPLFSNLLWWDTFIDLIWLWGSEKAMMEPNAWRRGFYGAVGTGLRLAIPSFPIAIYLIKRFGVNDRGSPNGFFNWNPGLSPTWKGPGLDFAIVFSIDMY